MQLESGGAAARRHMQLGWASDYVAAAAVAAASTQPVPAHPSALLPQVTLAAIMVTHVPLGEGATEGSLGLVQNIGLSHDRGWKDP